MRVLSSRMQTMRPEPKYCTHAGVAISVGSRLIRYGEGVWGVQTISDEPVPGYRVTR